MSLSLVKYLVRSHSWTTQTLRYLISGIAVYAIDYSTFLAINLVAPFHLVEANLTAKLVSAVAGFFAHRHFTFRANHRGMGWRQFAGYVLLLLTNAGVSSVLLLWSVDYLHWEPKLAKVAADIVITAIAFIASRVVVFRTHRAPCDAGSPGNR
jgi:putative flippase GtrA